MASSDMRPGQAPSYSRLAKNAYKAPLNDDGAPVLPSEWDEEDDLLEAFDTGEDMDGHFDFDHPTFPNREDKGCKRES